MPFPIAAAVGAAAPGIIDAISTSAQNRASRKWSERMYQRQYQDAIAFWNLQNDYNSPQAQMARFQEAGLNPHLIYGQGNAGNAGSIPVPDVKAPEFRPTNLGRIGIDAISGISAMYDLEIKKATADNLKEQNTVIQQEAALKAAQVIATKIGSSRGEFDLGLDYELRDISAQARKESLRQMTTGIDLSIRRDAREAAMNSTSINEALSRMETAVEQRANMRVERAKSSEEMRRIRADTLRIKQQIAIMRKDERVRALEADLADKGIRPGDPLWYRAVGSIIDLFMGE